MTKEMNSFLTLDDNLIEHKRRYSLADLPDLFAGFIYKVTNKRLAVAEQRIEKELGAETERLFKIISRNYIMTENDPFAGTPYSSRIWKKLSPNWIKRKKNRYFWYDKGILDSWYMSTKPSSVFGRPELRTTANKKARAWQKVTFSYRPYPYLEHPDIDREDIRYRLFGTNWGGDRNEEVRPVIVPAIRKLMDDRLLRKMEKILIESMEGGQYDGR